MDNIDNTDNTKKFKKVKLSIRDICLIGVFAAFISVCAQISIPTPVGVPFTLQTLVIPLTGIILGAKKGTLSAFVYVLLGAAGIPVFTGFTGGIGVIFGKTGGYILSFPIMAMCAGISSDLMNLIDLFSFSKANKTNKTDKIKNKNIWIKSTVIAAGLVLGAAINYICGMMMGKFILACSFSDAFMLFVLPYIPTAVIKIILSGVLGAGVKKLLRKSGIVKVK